MSKASPASFTCLPELWTQIEEHRRILTETGERAQKRQGQQVRWMWAMLENRLLGGLRSEPTVRQALPGIEAEVAKGLLTPSRAVETVLSLWRQTL